jgi:aminobenzoyl-glutamate utilization protein B
MTRLTALLLLGAVLGRPQLPDADRAGTLRSIDSRAEHFGQVSREIWEFAELGYSETKSSALLQKELASNGFKIVSGIAGAPTAFAATWGSGTPVIAILGEFDALPGLSQAATPAREPVIANGAGHGCGHNLLGTASVLAAITTKEYLEKHNLPGTLRYYGTPAEEGGGGKVFMANTGAFHDVDAVLAWHPEGAQRTGNISSLANITAKFKFHGIASHAAMAPEMGRSALDGVMLMNMGIEFLREHVPQETRIHYIITKGGSAPNIVPEQAETYLYARHPDMPTLLGIWARIQKNAEGAAMQTETKVDIALTGSVWNILPNDPLNRLMHRNLTYIGGSQYSADDEFFAEKLRATIGKKTEPGGQQNVPPFEESGMFSASTDAGDISWQFPMGHFMAATWVPGVSAHTWQAAACSGMSIGRKGMIVAAKTLSLSAIDLFLDPKLVAAAKADFKTRLGPQVYRSLTPLDQKPNPNYRSE